MMSKKIHIYPRDSVSANDDDDVVDDYSWWWQVDQRNHVVEELEVSSVYISNSMAFTLATIFQRKVVKSLILRMCEVWPDVLYDVLLQACRHNVEHLTLHRVRQIDDPCMRLITQPGTKLRSLSVHYRPSLEGDGIRVLLRRLHDLQCLETLRLDGSPLTGDNDVTALIHSLQIPGALSNLKVLSLKSCFLSDKAVARILSALEDPERLPSLMAIDLSLNGCNKHGMQALGRLLESPSCHLERLDLMCQIPRIQHRQYMQPLSHALTKNQSLKILRLSGNSLRDTSLLKSLAVNKGLEVLDWYGNHLDDRGLLTLSHALSQNRTLRSLNLKSNTFTSLHGLDLSTNDTLCHVGHTCRGPEARQIAFQCNLNAAGRRLVRQEDSINLGLWPMVMARCSDNADALFYFVRNTPSLWTKRENAVTSEFHERQHNTT